MSPIHAGHCCSPLLDERKHSGLHFCLELVYKTPYFPSLPVYDMVPFLLPLKQASLLWKVVIFLGTLHLSFLISATMLPTFLTCFLSCQVVIHSWFCHFSKDYYIVLKRKFATSSRGFKRSSWSLREEFSHRANELYKELIPVEYAIGHEPLFTT